MTIADQIKTLAKQAFKSERMYSQVCIVESVNETTRLAVCNPVDDTAQLQKVRLQTIGSQTNGLVCIPAVDSFVIVSFLDNRNGFITQTTELTKILIDTDLVQFNGGANGGLINIDDITTKLNDLSDKYNDLVQRLLAWTPVANDGGAKLKSDLTLPTPIEQNTAFNKDDYKDNSILH